MNARKIDLRRTPSAARACRPTAPRCWSTSSTRWARLPTRNFQDGYFPTADKIGGESLTAKQLVRAARAASLHHPLRPGHQGRQPGLRGHGEGPEYETAWAFGADCGIDDLDAVTKANYLCNEYGMDTITIGLHHRLRHGAVRARHHHDQGHRRHGRSRSATPRPWSRWSARSARARASATSWRRARTAWPRATATPRYSMTGKKQEMPAYDPRGVQGIGLNYATSNRGGCHVRGYTIATRSWQNGGQDRPARHRGQGRPGHRLPEPHRRARLDRRLPVRHLRHRRRTSWRRRCSALTGVDVLARRVPEGRRPHLEPGAAVEPQAGLHDGGRHAARAAARTIRSRPARPRARSATSTRCCPSTTQLRGWDENGVPTKAKLKELALLTGSTGRRARSSSRRPRRLEHNDDRQVLRDHPDLTRTRRNAGSTADRRRSGSCSSRWRRATAGRSGAPCSTATTCSPEIIILVNGRNVVHLRRLDTPLADDDEVSIFPMVAGG